MKNDEKGFAITEQILSLAVTAIIALAAGMTSAQIVASTGHNSDWNTAFRQAQNAGYWVSRDGLMAHSIDIGDDPGTTDLEFFTLSWNDWESGETHYIDYVWTDVADSLRELRRKEKVYNSSGVEIGNKTMLVATNVVTATLSSQSTGWLLSVETRSGNESTTREYEIGQRLQD